MTDVSAFLMQWDFDCAMIEYFARSKVDGDLRLIAFAGNEFNDDHQLATQLNISNLNSVRLCAKLRKHA